MKIPGPGKLQVENKQQ